MSQEATFAEYPPPQGRHFDPDWSPALVALFIVWLTVWCVGAYFFWRYA